MRTPLAGLAAAGLALAVAACGSSSSSSSSGSSTTARASGGTAAKGSGGATGVAGSQSTGKVKVIFQPPKTKADALGAFLLKKGLVPHISQLLARTFELPHPLTVVAVNGLGSGPFYSPQHNGIVLPYQFAALIFKTLRQSNPSWSPHRLGYATGAVDGFILEHEFGHALIANFDLPVLGKEEDAADTIATVLLLQSPEGVRLATDAAQFWADFSGRQDPPAVADYADVHSLDLQRADDIICFVAGSSQAGYRYVGSLTLLPKARLQSCPEEYSQAVDSIKAEIQPHVKKQLHLD